MTLPEDFLFSQSSLQDYWDCKRRFFLKHIRKLAWPSIESEPIHENEHFRLQGEVFHKMVHQFLIGIPPERLSGMTSDILLGTWWENFLACQSDLVELEKVRLYPEITITASLEGFRLLAKVDLLSLRDNGSCLIYDWKTYRKRPRREHLSQKLQTRLYPFLLIHSGTILSQPQPLPPEKLNMVYWYANFPLQPEKFPYSFAQYQQDRQFISKLILSISRAAQSGQEQDFPLTDNPDRCLFCVYRSLCNRGIRAGNLDEDLAEIDLNATLDDFDFEHISEIEF